MAKLSDRPANRAEDAEGSERPPAVQFANDAELQWTLAAVESEMARRGRLVDADPVLHITILTHLAAAYEQLRRATQ